MFGSVAVMFRLGMRHSAGQDHGARSTLGGSSVDQGVGMQSACREDYAGPFWLRYTCIICMYTTMLGNITCVSTDLGV